MSKIKFVNIQDPFVSVPFGRLNYLQEPHTFEMIVSPVAIAVAADQTFFFYKDSLGAKITFTILSLVQCCKGGTSKPRRD